MCLSSRRCFCFRGARLEMQECETSRRTRTRASPQVPYRERHQDCVLLPLPEIRKRILKSNKKGSCLKMLVPRKVPTLSAFKALDFRSPGASSINIRGIDALASPTPLPLSGYNRLCLSLDRHHIREYVKHPRALLKTPEKGAANKKPRDAT